MVECDVEKWADGASSRAQWRKAGALWRKAAEHSGEKDVVRAIEAPLLETISLLNVNTLLTRTPSSCPLQCNKKIVSVNF